MEREAVEAVQRKYPQEIVVTKALKEYRMSATMERDVRRLQDRVRAVQSSRLSEAEKHSLLLQVAKEIDDFLGDLSFSGARGELELDNSKK